MELTGVRSKIWNEGDYPPVSSSGGYLRGYICTIWDLVWPHITLWFRPGLDLTLARPLSPMSHTGRGMGSTLPRTLITFIGRWQSFNLNTLSQQQPGSVLVMAPGACTLDTGHCPVTLFCAEDTRGSQRAPPPDITLTVCNCISREVAQISAQSFALISFHKNPSPFWLFLWLFYAAWFRAGRAWRLESTQLGFRIESQPHPTIKLF